LLTRTDSLKEIAGREAKQPLREKGVEAIQTRRFHSEKRVGKRTMVEIGIGQVYFV
jgi:hypothetical protein